MAVPIEIRPFREHRQTALSSLSYGNALKSSLQRARGHYTDSYWFVKATTRLSRLTGKIHILKHRLAKEEPSDDPEYDYYSYANGNEISYHHPANLDNQELPSNLLRT
jgi:hypothetical protein